MEAFINEMVEPRVLDLIVLILPKWKLLVYIFLMNVVIFSPLYFFSVIQIGNNADLMLICPSAMLFGFNLIHRALFVRHNLNNTRSMLVGAVIMGAGISTSGVVAMYSDDRGTFPTIVLLYSFVGGYGYHLVFSKMWKVLAKIFNAKKEMFVIKFLHSFGQSMTPLLLLVIFHCSWIDYIYGALLVLFGGMLLHLIPLTILIEQEKNFLKLDQDSLIKHTQKGKESFYNDVSKNLGGIPDVPLSDPTPSVPEQIPMLSWKNPAKFVRGDELDNNPTVSEDDYCDCDNEDTFNREGKYFNADGVEILEIIIEEDDERIAAYDAETEHATLPKLDEKDQWLTMTRLMTSVVKLYHSIQMQQSFNRRMRKSLHFAVRELKFYSCLLLKSTDLCTFILFLTILPRFMLHHYHSHRGKQPRQIMISSLIIMSASWACCATLLLWCDLKFRKQQDKLLIFSILFKVFGYFCVYSTRSSFWTVTGCVLIGVGHAIACSYQELVFKRKFSVHQWPLVKTALCFFSGVLIVIMAGLINLAYTYCRIDSVLLALLLVYCCSGGVWLVCNYRIIFR